MSKLIYIADDEKNIRHLIVSFLTKEGYEATGFETGDALYEAFVAAPCDLVILDVMMPGSNGFTICTKLREISRIPIIMLTARDTEEDYVSGISLGSDDYFTKPFSPVKLVMRIKALLRRVDMDTGGTESKDILTYGDIVVHMGKLAAYQNEIDLELTATEFNLLLYLFKNPDRAVSREELLNSIWGYDNAVESRATDDTVKRLRRKLKNSNVLINTLWGYGFRLDKR